MTPPILARAIVAATAPRADYESIAGDLHEEYGRRARCEGESRADAWYWSQALRSIPSMLAYSRMRDGSWIRVGIGVFVSIALVAMLIVNEAAGHAVSQIVSATTGLGTWPYFLAAWLDAAIFGFIIAALVRSRGMRLALTASVCLVLVIVVPIPLRYSSPLSALTYVMLFGAVPFMCAGAGLYQVLRRH